MTAETIREETIREQYKARIKAVQSIEELCALLNEIDAEYYDCTELKAWGKRPNSEDNSQLWDRHYYSWDTTGKKEKYLALANTGPAAWVIVEQKEEEEEE